MRLSNPSYKNRTRPPAVIHVDLDGAWVILNHLGGGRGDINDDPVFYSGVPRFIDLFRRCGIKAAFFITGRDVEVPEKREWVEAILSEGHEICSHSYSHPREFSSLDREGKKAEIEKAGKVIHDAFGIEVRGFRAPNFQVDSETLSLLSESGYRFDSSVLPFPYGPLLRSISRIRSRRPIPPGYLGRFTNSFAPIRPYRCDPGCVWKRGKSRLMELPISVIPCVRLPMHSSSALWWRRLYLDGGLLEWGLRCNARRGNELTYLFHVCDLSDEMTDPVLSSHSLLNIPAREKEERAELILERIQAHYEIVSTGELLARVEKEGPG